jgi:hypothetical protein
MGRGIPVRHPGGLYVQPGSKPIILGIDPPSAKINVAATVTITGGGFTPSSAVKLDGNDLVGEQFIDDTHIRIGIPSFAAPGSKALTVTTGALVSNAVNFQITVT